MINTKEGLRIIYYLATSRMAEYKDQTQIGNIKPYNDWKEVKIIVEQLVTVLSFDNTL